MAGIANVWYNSISILHHSSKPLQSTTLPEQTRGRICYAGHACCMPLRPRFWNVRRSGPRGRGNGDSPMPGPCSSPGCSPGPGASALWRGCSGSRRASRDAQAESLVHSEECLAGQVWGLRALSAVFSTMDSFFGSAMLITCTQTIMANHK